MDFKNIPREERENLYIKKETELQTRWKNPLTDDWSFIKEWPDKELNESIEGTIGQLKFEKVWGGIGLVVRIMIGGFVIIGIIGLLVFGIRQIF